MPRVMNVPDGMAAGIGDFFASVLFKASNIKLVERERIDDIAAELRLGASGGFVPLPFVAVSTTTQKAKADLDVRVVKVETSEVVFAQSGSGEASASNTGLATSWFGVTNSEFDGVEGNAIFNAVVRLAPEIQKALTGRDTLTEVLKAEFKQAMKSAGKSKAKNTAEEKSSSKSKRKSAKKSKTKEEAPIAVAEVSPTDEGEAKTVADSNQTPSVGVSSAPEQPEVKEPAAFENKSTDPAKVIATYALSSGEKNTLRIKHLSINKQGKKQKAYDEFVKLVEEYGNDYLAAFKAGEVAQALGDKDNAELWYNKALEINPNYEPAQKAKEKLSSAPAPKKSSKKRKK